MTKETAEKIKKNNAVKSIEMVCDTTLNSMAPDESGFQWRRPTFPYQKNYNWTRDNFGPIYVPKAGVTIDINIDNICLYERIIDVYENNDLEIKGDKIFINRVESTTYTFKMDYYWMMGDNRHNSADSRYWGFVPYDHIVGNAVFVWLSLSKEKSLFKKIRWNKIFRVIK